jgi:signal transduction histidine kinase/CheY-like chemotaxis protein
LLTDIELAPGVTRHIAGPRRHCKKDGSLIYVEITDHPLFFLGRDAIIVLAHDVTHRAQLEEQLRQSQKLEAVGQLAGGVAHDFNNMLTVISGYAEFLGDSPRTTAEDRGAITEIAGAAERARSLTQQLLAFSRRQVLQPKVFRLADSVRNIQKMLARLLGEDIELQTVVAEDSWNVSADPGQVDQILVNLAINARDAMDNGGTLAIEVSNVLLDADYAATHVGVSPGDYVRLSVTDTGHGMDADTKARLFEPFFTTKEVGKGTGLGLSTVYGIVKQTGGNIWVYSEPGHGTTFAVYLPRSAAPVPASSVRHRPSAPPPTGQVVLLVEDDPSVCKMVSAMITNSGYLVRSAKSIEEALHHSSSSQRIDLLLCDMVLPHVSGPAIAEKVLSLRPGLPVLFMSGYTEHAVLRQQGINESIPFLQKPFSREALINKIRSMLTPVNGAE